MGQRLPKQLMSMIEKDWDMLLFGAQKGLASGLGWSSYHTLRSRGSAPGFPDRTLWRDRVVFAELKTMTGKPTDRQVKVLDGLAKAGAEVYLWRPGDLDEIGRILSAPWAHRDGWLTKPGPSSPSWTPDSLWLHEHSCRADELLPHEQPAPPSPQLSLTPDRAIAV